MNDLINPENHKEEDDGNKEKSEYSKKNIILSFLSYSFVFFLGIGISLLAGADSQRYNMTSLLLPLILLESWTGVTVAELMVDVWLLVV